MRFFLETIGSIHWAEDILDSLQGYLVHPMGRERIILKRIKERVEVKAAHTLKKCLLQVLQCSAAGSHEVYPFHRPEGLAWLHLCIVFLFNLLCLTALMQLTSIRLTVEDVSDQLPIRSNRFHGSA